MYNYSIVAHFPGHEREVCADILRQYREGIADLALFRQTLVPEGNPPADKAKILGEGYDLCRDILAESGAECGILVQASIGHGWKLSVPFPYQKFINLSDGSGEEIVCPYDRGFRQFFRSQMHEVASHRPKMIMLDDDFRLLGHKGFGCGCPLHMAAFHRLSGTALTRQELFDVLSGPESPEQKRLAACFLQTQKEALLGAAKEFRAGIDEVDPKLPGSYCTVGGEFGAEIAAIMAGEGNPVILRINNGNYSAAGAHRFTDKMLAAAYQMATLAHPVDAVLAETDTCPQNRYSTGCAMLHAHFTGTILEGACGAKHWITRLTSFEPGSGEAYRRTLARYAPFYAALADITPTLRPFGCRVPLPGAWSHSFRRPFWEKLPEGWSGCVLERLGLPLYFSAKAGGAVLLEEDADAAFTDAELRQMLSGMAFVSGESARRLCARGLGDLLGVSVRGWEGLPMSTEVFPGGDCTCPVQQGALELVPAPGAQVRSTVCHVPDGKTRLPLFPGVVSYRNAAGGLVVTFCGRPRTAYNISEAYAFLNAPRKAQMAALLAEGGHLPLYYPDDSEVYLRGGMLPDGRLFCAAFNLSYDGADTLPLQVAGTVRTVQALGEDGRWRNIPFTTRPDGATDVQTPMQPLLPVVLALTLQA